MLPLKSLAPRRAFPVITLSIIGLNLYVFLHQIAMSPAQMARLAHVYGLVPARFEELFSGGHISLAAVLLPLITSMFLHAGWLHILGNMWFLWIFGATVEDRLGHIPYLLFYFVCGIVAGLTQVALTWTSAIPSIGASGAISGVLAAYLVIYPSARILTLIPIVIIPWILELPAIIFIGLWFVLQFLGGLGSLSGPGAQPVAWWAHIGGFGMGLVLMLEWRRKRRRLPNYYYG